MSEPTVDRDDFEAHDGAGNPTNLDSTIGPEASSADPRATIEMAEQLDHDGGDDAGSALESLFPKGERGASAPCPQPKKTGG